MVIDTTCPKFAVLGSYDPVAAKPYDYTQSSTYSATPGTPDQYLNELSLYNITGTKVTDTIAMDSNVIATNFNFLLASSDEGVAQYYHADGIFALTRPIPGSGY